jgi:hypothetical protein
VIPPMPLGSLLKSGFVVHAASDLKSRVLGVLVSIIVPYLFMLLRAYLPKLCVGGWVCGWVGGMHVYACVCMCAMFVHALTLGLAADDVICVSSACQVRVRTMHTRYMYITCECVDIYIHITYICVRVYVYQVYM